MEINFLKNIHCWTTMWLSIKIVRKKIMIVRKKIMRITKY